MSGLIEYNQSVAEEILNRMSDGETVKAILESDGMPSGHVWRTWLNGENLAPSSLPRAHARARQLQADGFAADIIALADNVDEQSHIAAQAAVDALPEDASATEKRRAYFYAKKRSVEGAKLSIDVRKWSAARMCPSRWGDKVTLEHTTDEDNPMRVDLTQLPTELLERIMLLQEEVVDVTGNGEATIDAKQLAFGSEHVSKKPWDDM